MNFDAEMNNDGRSMYCYVSVESQEMSQCDEFWCANGLRGNSDVDISAVVIILLLTHLAWKSPIETSYDDELDDATMIYVEAAMECVGSAMYFVVVNSSLCLQL